MLNRETSEEYHAKKPELCKFEQKIHCIFKTKIAKKYYFVAGEKQLKKGLSNKRRRPGFFKEIFMIYKYG